MNEERFRARVYTHAGKVTYEAYDTRTGAVIMTDDSGPGYWSRAHDDASWAVAALTVMRESRRPSGRPSHPRED